MEPPPPTASSYMVKHDHFTRPPAHFNTELVTAARITAKDAKAASLLKL